MHIISQNNIIRSVSIRSGEKIFRKVILLMSMVSLTLQRKRLQTESNTSFMIVNFTIILTFGKCGDSGLMSSDFVVKVKLNEIFVLTMSRKLRVSSRNVSKKENGSRSRIMISPKMNTGNIGHQTAGNWYLQTG